MILVLDYQTIYDLKTLNIGQLLNYFLRLPFFRLSFFLTVQNKETMRIQTLTLRLNETKSIFRVQV